MTTAPFENKNIHYTSDVIHDFFSNFGFAETLHDLEGILKAAVDDRIWKREQPANLLCIMRNLEELSAAVFVLHHYYSEGVGIILYAESTGVILVEPENGEPDMLVQEDFLDKRFSTVWDGFPRSLTARQYHNPYRAIKKFCTYMTERQWKRTLRELTEYALNEDTIDEINPAYNILTVRLRLMQLIEACHLIEIRSNRKTAEPKTKKKKAKK